MDGIVYHKCKRCNRALKTEKAKQRGFGDFCWKMHILEVNRTKKYLLDSYIPVQKQA